MIKLPVMNAKNMNRFVLCLLLIAPIFYLFGSLFTALNGANGVQLFSQEEEETLVDMSVSYGGNTYTRICYANSAYAKFFNASFDSGGEFYIGESSGVPAMDTCPFYEMHGYAVEGTDFYISFLIQEDQWKISEVILDEYTCMSLSFVSNTKLYYLEAFRTLDFSYTLYDSAGDYYENDNIFDIILGGVDYVSSSYSLAETYALSRGFDTIDFTARVRHIPEVQPSITTPSVSEEISYSDYVFGQFFAKDNFLVQMGKDSLSDTDSGFLPANSLVRIIDDNILHYGRDNQIACMAYGYFVWVFNVIVLDMVVYLSVRLLILPLKAVDLFDRREDR